MESLVSIMRGVLSVDTMMVGMVEGPLAYLVVARAFGQATICVTPATGVPLLRELLRRPAPAALRINDLRAESPVAEDSSWVTAEHLAALRAHPWTRGEGPGAAEVAGLGAQSMAPGIFCLFTHGRPISGMSDEVWGMFRTIKALTGELDVVRDVASAKGLSCYPPLPPSEIPPEADAARAQAAFEAHRASRAAFEGHSPGATALVFDASAPGWPVVYATPALARTLVALETPFWGRSLWDLFKDEACASGRAVSRHTSGSSSAPCARTGKAPRAPSEAGLRGVVERSLSSRTQGDARGRPGPRRLPATARLMSGLRRGATPVGVNCGLEVLLGLPEGGEGSPAASRAGDRARGAAGRDRQVSQPPLAPDEAPPDAVGSRQHSASSPGPDEMAASSGPAVLSEVETHTLSPGTQASADAPTLPQGGSQATALPSAAQPGSRRPVEKLETILSGVAAGHKSDRQGSGAPRSPAALPAGFCVATVAFPNLSTLLRDVHPSHRHEASPVAISRTVDKEVIDNYITVSKSSRRGKTKSGSKSGSSGQDGGVPPLGTRFSCRVPFEEVPADGDDFVDPSASRRSVAGILDEPPAPKPLIVAAPAELADQDSLPRGGTGRRGSMELPGTKSEVGTAIVGDLVIYEEVRLRKGVYANEYLGVWKGAEVHITVLRHLGPPAVTARSFFPSIMDPMLALNGTYPNVGRPFHYACTVASERPTVKEIALQDGASARAASLTLTAVEGGAVYLAAKGAAVSSSKKEFLRGISTPNGSVAAAPATLAQPGSVGLLGGGDGSNQGSRRVGEARGGDAFATSSVRVAQAARMSAEAGRYDAHTTLPRDFPRDSSLSVETLRRSRDARSALAETAFRLPTLLSGSTGRDVALWDTWVVHEVPDGTLAEMMAGETLRAVPGSAASCLPAVRVAIQCLSGLGHLHSHGILHGCLTPASISVFEGAIGNRYKVCDYGLCQLLATQTGVAPVCLGAGLRYQAPERLTAVPLGPASDIYSVGLILAECLTGERPWAGEPVLSRIERARAAFGRTLESSPSQVHHLDPSPGALAAIGFPLALPDTLPAELLDFLRSALSPNPAARPSCAQAVDRLKEFVRTNEPSRSTNSFL